MSIFVKKEKLLSKPKTINFGNQVKSEKSNFNKELNFTVFKEE